jgi:serine O-acetyltransferase
VSDKVFNSRIPPLPKGDTNENPKGVSLLQLLAEDYKTHDRSLMEPGFWAVAVHRFGNWRMGLRKPLRAPCTVAYRTLQTCVHWGWGIKLDYTVKVGRRVRIWHHGGMVLGARSIGDDVHIRQNTTFGVAHRDQPSAKPMIGDRVDIGCGAVIVGHTHVGHDSVVGANAVVTQDVPAFSMVAGVPARVIKTLGRATSERPAPLVSDVAPRRQTGELSPAPEINPVPAAAGATRPWRARA